MQDRLHKLFQVQRTISRAFLDEVFIGEVGGIVDLEFLVERLDLCLEGVLTVGVLELGLNRLAGIGNVDDKDNAGLL